MNNISNSTNAKRPFETIIAIDIENKRNKSDGSNSGIARMSDIHWNEILTYLSPKELLDFEQSNKYFSKLTQHTWKMLCQEKLYHFNWEDFSKKEFEEQLDKWNYALSAILEEWVFKHRFSNDIPQIAKFFAKNFNLTKKFSNFHAFFKCVLASKITVPEVDLFFINKIFACSNKGWTGDSMLYALMEIGAPMEATYTRTQIENISKAFHRAFSNSNTTAAHYGVPTLQFDFFLDLSIDLSLAAANKKDFRAICGLLHLLQQCFNHDKRTDILRNMLTKIPEKSITRGVINFELAQHLPSSPEKSQLMDEACEFFAPIARPAILLKLARFKFEGEFFQEAFALYDQGIAKLGNQAPLELLILYAEEQLRIQRFLEADKIYSKFIDKEDELITAEVLDDAANVKYVLRLYHETDLLITRAIAKYGDDVTAEALALAADVKFKLVQYHEADRLFIQAIPKYDDNVPARLLAIAADVKYELRQYLEADRLITQASTKFGDSVPAELLHKAGRVKTELGQFAEADLLLTQSRVKFGIKVPTRLLAFAACTKMVLKQYHEADQLFTESIAIFGIKVSAHVLRDAALVKMNLNLYLEADELWTKAIAEYGNDVPARVLGCAALAKKELKLYKEAVELFNRSKAKYGSKMPQGDLEAAAEAEAMLLKLNIVEESKD